MKGITDRLRRIAVNDNSSQVHFVKTLRLLGAASVFGIVVAACSSSNALTGVTPGAANQNARAFGPNGVLSPISTRRGWMSPESRKRKKLLYVSDNGEIAIFSVPGSRKAGRITDGIGAPPMGLATDKNGYLYVANGKRTVTVYKPGTTSPWLTLHGHGRFNPVDVAVGSNEYVYVADSRRGPGNGIYVYAPGATGSMRHLANAALANGVMAVNVDASNNVYASGRSSAGAAVVKFANAHGPGTNLGLRGLTYPDGVIVDNHNNLLVSDFSKTRSSSILPATRRRLQSLRSRIRPASPSTNQKP